jgi:Pyruvate/2-oxoacid:ferredoxin oxidoreductase delta subunit
MTEQDLAFHYVCTRTEAWDLVQEHDRFWVMNCGCREERGECARSRMDVCLMFRGDIEGSAGSGKHEASRSEVAAIFSEAENKRLVTRPFRNDEDRSVTEGICFCCDDCCGYFLDPDEICDKGSMIEGADVSSCTHCGTCAGVCYFGARRMVDDRLDLDQAGCYGCGLCADVCPVTCIQMVRRR